MNELSELKIDLQHFARELVAIVNLLPRSLRNEKNGTNAFLIHDKHHLRVAFDALDREQCASEDGLPRFKMVLATRERKQRTKERAAALICCWEACFSGALSLSSVSPPSLLRSLLHSVHHTTVMLCQRPRTISFDRAVAGTRLFSSFKCCLLARGKIRTSRAAENKRAASLGAQTMRDGGRRGNTKAYYVVSGNGEVI